MNNKEITGLFVRVERNKRWENLDIACLTNEELEEFFASIDEPLRIKNFAIALARWIRDNVVTTITCPHCNEIALPSEGDDTIICDGCGWWLYLDEDGKLVDSEEPYD